MFGIQERRFFIACGLLLDRVPSPDSLFSVARNGGQGWRDGSAAALGVGAPAAAKSSTLPLGTVFHQSFLTNLLKPKLAAAMLAFVPQFIAANASRKALAFIALGTHFNFSSMRWPHLMAVVTSTSRRHLRVSSALQRRMGHALGAVFVSFGV